MFLAFFSLVSASETCSSGEYLTESYNCAQCRFLFENCLECDSSTCWQCNDKYYLNQEFCSPCIDYCDICSDGYTCILCESNTIINSQQTECTKCLEGCNECSSETVYSCRECIEGYQLVAVENSDKTICEICDNEVCSSCKNNICECKPMYASLTRGVGVRCVPCMPNCNSCSGEGEFQVCFSCESGFSLIGNNCCPYDCSACYRNSTCIAKTASDEETNNGNADEATNNDNSDSCFQKKCKTCKESTSVSCISCYKGYYLDDEESCSECSDNCLTCSNTHNNCTSCSSGRSLIGSTCCPEGCLQCNNTTYKCSACSEGFMLNASYFCVNCPFNCKKCSESVCECSSGIFFENFIYQPCEDFFYAVYGVLIITALGYFSIFKLRKQQIVDENIQQKIFVKLL